MSKKGRYTEEQIIRALKEVEAGAKTDEVCRRLGVTQTTFYRWKSKYGGMDVSEARRLKQLEDENRRLKQMVADLSLARTVRSTPGHGSARLLPWRLSLTRLTEDQLSDPKGDLNVLSPKYKEPA